MLGKSSLVVALVASASAWPTAQRGDLQLYIPNWVGSWFPSFLERRQAPGDGAPASCAGMCSKTYSGALMKGGRRVAVRTEMEGDGNNGQGNGQGSSGGATAALKFPGDPTKKGLYRPMGIAFTGPASSHVAVLQEAGIASVFVTRLMGVMDQKVDGATTEGTVCVDLGENNMIQVRADTAEGFAADTTFKLWVVDQDKWEQMDPCVPTFSAKLRNRLNEREVSDERTVDSTRG
eukprot:comp7762_c0_seq1/m.3384 comp7762_c0_seq1/g.3384  ORF comp7762_c0_seq1/g.3384 comp7762_c0_seq1/m.3384 type:complete len:234 (-) comp7762_c0_seq1:433-1134(-)